MATSPGEIASRGNASLSSRFLIESITNKNAAALRTVLTKRIIRLTVMLPCAGAIIKNGIEKIRFTSFNLQIFAGVENIFDKNYRDHLSTTRGSITIEPGRNFFIKLITEI